MKAIKFAALLVTASVTLGAISNVAMAQGKSRAQVHQELVQAQHEGVVPTSKTQYPPTEAQVARNKQVHATSRHAGEVTPNVDHHDSVAAR
ncbi:MULTISPECIES: DUF4148 domain-containing protein [Caballeronia]|uniref:DUF4148 domain-containing protein n=1 Tax=Caballeronia TaxID=1827195 RepID=UPI00094E89DE|nr:MULTISPECIES: DUF4148 domain-containing protein [Caballeronia]MCE4547802.1 DUF4148 domain-containing protein [Caballeronia sp. PC1]MCE4575643.1 DUF4148 domain-containing protein [Caballeronia sp. CLC5]